jgi:hypothetical protein
MATATGTAPGLTIVYRARGVATVADSAATFGVGGAAGSTAGVGRDDCSDGGSAVSGRGPGIADGEEAVSCRTGVARRDEGKIIGVTTRTSAMSTSARRVRLSMQTGAVARELDHSRPVVAGCIVQSAAGQANLRASRHVVRALRSHTRNSLDNSGTRAAAAARASPDTHGRPAPGWFAYVHYGYDASVVTRV